MKKNDAAQVTWSKHSQKERGRGIVRPGLTVNEVTMVSHDSEVWYWTWALHCVSLLPHESINSGDLAPVAMEPSCSSQRTCDTKRRWSTVTGENNLNTPHELSKIPWLNLLSSKPWHEAPTHTHPKCRDNEIMTIPFNQQHCNKWTRGYYSQQWSVLW